MNYKDCKYNTSKSSSFDGYCKHPTFQTKPNVQLLIHCKKCPCEHFTKRGEDEEEE